MDGFQTSERLNGTTTFC